MMMSTATAATSSTVPTTPERLPACRSQNLTNSCQLKSSAKGAETAGRQPAAGNEPEEWMSSVAPAGRPGAAGRRGRGPAGQGAGGAVVVQPDRPVGRVGVLAHRGRVVDHDLERHRPAGRLGPDVLLDGGRPLVIQVGPGGRQGLRV